MVPTNFRSLELAVEFYRECSKLRLKAHLKDQLERAALSIALNLAEGAAKPTRADQARFFAMSYGSARECQALLRIIGEEALFAKADAIGAHIYRLRKSLG